MRQNNFPPRLTETKNRLKAIKPLLYCSVFLRGHFIITVSITHIFSNLSICMKKLFNEYDGGWWASFNLT